MDYLRLVFHLIGIIIAVFAGVPLISVLLKKYRFKNMPEGFKNAGKLIGIFERFLIYVALFYNSAALIGIVLTLKAIYRFGDIQGDASVKMKLSEYFIIGTLSSLSWVIIIFGISELLLTVLK